MSPACENALVSFALFSEQRVSQLDELNSHFQAIEEHKEKLAARLQQPYVGEFLHIDAAYKKWDLHHVSYNLQTNDCQYPTMFHIMITSFNCSARAIFINILKELQQMFWYN